MPDITEFSSDPPTATVKVGGKDIEVRALGARAFAGLARRYPLLVELMNGGNVEAGTALSLDLADMAPALVASAARRPQDEESIAGDLLFHECMPAMLKVIELTIAPPGQQPGPLVASSDPAPLTEGSATK